jgi:uncharacterized protein YcnI
MAVARRLPFEAVFVPRVGGRRPTQAIQFQERLVMKTPNGALIAGLLAALPMLAVAPALAHVTLEVGEAPVNSSYKATLRVPHGCDGAATTKLRVQIPEGIIGVKPMPKAGWQLETVKGKYEKTYKLYGSDVSEGVKEIVWTGNLPDEFYDEFVFRGFLADALKPDTMLYIPTIQECQTGVERWIEVPAEGKSHDDYEFPAPGLKLLPPGPEED